MKIVTYNLELLKEKNNGSPPKHGIAMVADQVVSWELNYSALYKDYEIDQGEFHIDSLPDLENGKKIRCGYEFSFKPAEWMEE